ncbi:MAG TPA: hypothetical protein VHG33_03580 [Woeseiaceae bacterium]|nr:hypothetical protein [Woeseiaceae bacterium]
MTASPSAPNQKAPEGRLRGSFGEHHHGGHDVPVRAQQSGRSRVAAIVRIPVMGCTAGRARNTPGGCGKGMPELRICELMRAFARREAAIDADASPYGRCTKLLA